MRPNFFFKALEWHNGKMKGYFQAHIIHPQKARVKCIASLTLSPAIQGRCTFVKLHRFTGLGEEQSSLVQIHKHQPGEEYKHTGCLNSLIEGTTSRCKKNCPLPQGLLGAQPKTYTKCAARSGSRVSRANHYVIIYFSQRARKTVMRRSS